MAYEDGEDDRWVGEYLTTAVENPHNEIVANTSMSEIDEIKRSVLAALHAPKAHERALLRALRDYRYVDELSDVREGCYTRWIVIHPPIPAPKLTIGGILCEVKMDDAGVVMVCKNSVGRFFQFRAENALMFQKLTMQERVVLSAMELLKKR